MQLNHVINLINHKRSIFTSIHIHCLENNSASNYYSRSYLLYGMIHCLIILTNLFNLSNLFYEYMKINLQSSSFDTATGTQSSWDHFLAPGKQSRAQGACSPRMDWHSWRKYIHGLKEQNLISLK